MEFPFLRSRAPSRALLTIALAMIGAAAGSDARGEGDWQDVREAGAFQLRSEVPLDDWKTLVGELKELRSDVESQLGIHTVGDDAGAKIQINLFRNHRNYARYLADRVPSGAGRPACFVQGEDLGRVYLVRQGDWMVNLRHEVTHALLHQSLSFLPLWLDEGLAVYFEEPRDVRSRKPPHLATVRWHIRFGWRPDVDALETREDLSEMRLADYRHAWAWVHFLLNESDESAQLLRDYLKEIELESPPGPLSGVLRNELGDSDARLVKHFQMWKK